MNGGCGSDDISSASMSWRSVSFIGARENQGDCSS